jgi:hypothetical protein
MDRVQLCSKTKLSKMIYNWCLGMDDFCKLDVSDWTYIDVFMCELDGVCDDRAFFDACELNQFWFNSEQNLFM